MNIAYQVAQFRNLIKNCDRSAQRNILMINIAPLPTGFRVRPATMSDLEAVFHVQLAQEVADFGELLSGMDSLRNTWQAGDMDLEVDTWVVEAPDEHIVSYACIRRKGQAQFFANVWVLPEYQQRGIGRYLLSLAEAQVQQRMAQTTHSTFVVINAIWISERNQAAQHLLERAGYQKVLSFSSMEMDLELPPPAPVWNNGIVVRPFCLGKDEQAAYEVDEEIAHDERRHVLLEFGEWQRQHLSDPASIFLAWDEDKIAGLVIGEAISYQGWIWHLGVRRPWRKQGLGMALLRQVQGEFYRRNLRKMKLNVDTRSLTGAFRLYERSGMHTLFQYHRYEKELWAAEGVQTE
jgi:mycothiol synthase